MKINTSLALRESFQVVEEIDASRFDLSANFSLKGIHDLVAKALVSYKGELVHVSIDLTGVLDLECAYTLDIFQQKLQISDELFFSNKQDDDEEDVFFERGPLIELDQYIFGLILAHIPLRVIKPGAKLPLGDEIVEVMREDEYIKTRNVHNNPFNDIDLEDFPD